MTESVSAKHLLTKVEPDYPPDAKSRGLEGDVTFQVIILSTRLYETTRLELSPLSSSFAQVLWKIYDRIEQRHWGRSRSRFESFSS
jgi:hypothetical protein